MALKSGSTVNVAPGGPDVGRSGGRRPAWSPDGNTLVFHYSQNWDGGAADDAQTTFDLWVTHRATDGSGWSPAVRLTNLGPGARALHPRFANGTGQDALSYSYRPSPTIPYSLYVIDSISALESAVSSDAGPAGKLLLSGADALLSTWSSDNKQIAYASSCSGAVQVVDVNRGAGSWQVSGSARTVASSSGCGLSFSRSVPNLLTYSGNGRIYVKDPMSTSKAASIGSGSMPSW